MLLTYLRAMRLRSLLVPREQAYLIFQELGPNKVRQHLVFMLPSNLQCVESISF